MKPKGNEKIRFIFVKLYFYFSLQLGSNDPDIVEIGQSRFGKVKKNSLFSPLSIA